MNFTNNYQVTAEAQDLQLSAMGFSNNEFAAAEGPTHRYTMDIPAIPMTIAQVQSLQLHDHRTRLGIVNSSRERHQNRYLVRGMRFHRIPTDICELLAYTRDYHTCYNAFVPESSTQIPIVVFMLQDMRQTAETAAQELRLAESRLRAGDEQGTEEGLRAAAEAVERGEAVTHVTELDMQALDQAIGDHERYRFDTGRQSERTSGASFWQWRNCVNQYLEGFEGSIVPTKFVNGTCEANAQDPTQRWALPSMQDDAQPEVPDFTFNHTYTAVSNEQMGGISAQNPVIAGQHGPNYDWKKTFAPDSEQGEVNHDDGNSLVNNEFAPLPAMIMAENLEHV